MVPEVSTGTGEVSMNTSAKDRLPRLGHPALPRARSDRPPASSAWKGRTNITTMGWHMLMEFQPSLVGCVRAVYAGRIHEYRDTGKSSIRPSSADGGASLSRGWRSLRGIR